MQTIKKLASTTAMMQCLHSVFEWRIANVINGKHNNIMKLMRSVGISYLPRASTPRANLLTWLPSPFVLVSCLPPQFFAAALLSTESTHKSREDKNQRWLNTGMLNHVVATFKYQTSKKTLNWCTILENGWTTAKIKYVENGNTISTVIIGKKTISLRVNSWSKVGYK